MTRSPVGAHAATSGDGDALPRHDRFPNLDGLRAVAVMAVVGTHTAFAAGRYTRGLGAALLARLDVGVAVFFVLSGFLLSRPWLIAALAGDGAPRLPAYLWRRFLRIVPMYYLTVVAALTLVRQNVRVTAADWLHQFTLTQIYKFGWLRQGISQTWSLCTEAAFYLLLPALGAAALRWTRRHGWRPRSLLAGCVAFGSVSVIWAFVIIHTGWALRLSAGTWLPAYASWFGVGIGLAVLHVDLLRDPSRWPRVRVLAASPGICATAASAAFILTATPVAGPLGLGIGTAGELITKNLLYAAAAGLLLLPCALGSSRTVSALLANAPMQWLGRISYSIFLVHLTVLDIVQRTLGFRPFASSALQLFVITFGVSVAVSALSYRFVEEPAMRLRRLVPDRRRAGPRPPAEPALPPSGPA